jgi:hypothetical protein
MTDWSQFTQDKPAAPTQTIDWSQFRPLTEEEKKPKRTLAGTVKDVGITALKGAIGVPEAAVGLADLVSGGHAGKALEKVGFKPALAKSILNENYSDAQKAANAEVDKAKGFLPTLGAMAQNPSTIATTIGESLPSMLAGGAVGRGLVGAAKLAPYLAGGIGEGVVGAGSKAEQIRQQTPDGLLTPKQSLLAAGSGALDAVISAGSGKLSQKLGITDADTLLAGGTQGATNKGLARRIGEGALVEGALEETPQSMQEQMMQNLALGKDPMDGVGKAAATGLLTGGVMGGGMGVLHQNQPAPIVEPPPVEPSAQVPPVQPIAPEPTTPYPSNIQQDGVTRPARPDFTMDLAGKEVTPYQQGEVAPIAPTPEIKPNSPLSNAAVRGGISTKPQPPVSSYPKEIYQAKAYDPEQVKRDAEQKAKLAAIANEPNRPTVRPLEDTRVEPHAEVLKNMAKDVVPNGGVTIMPDGSRTPSVNPDWYQGLRDALPTANLTPKAIEIAVNKAAEGKPLYKNQEAIVTAMLDHIDGQIEDNQPSELDRAFNRLAPHIPEEHFNELVDEARNADDIEKFTQNLNLFADDYENKQQQSSTEPEPSATTNELPNAPADETTRRDNTDIQPFDVPVADASNFDN